MDRINGSNDRDITLIVSRSEFSRVLIVHFISLYFYYAAVNVFSLPLHFESIAIYNFVHRSL